MKSLWNDSEAARCESELDLRVYTSRLLGSDPDLVLHGGGNTSVKLSETNLFGENEEILYVKGSGFRVVPEILHIVIPSQSGPRGPRQSTNGPCRWRAYH